MKQIYTFTSGISGSSVGREIIPEHTIAMTGNTVSKGKLRVWARTVAVIALLVFTVSIARSQRTITITANTNWSAIPGGLPSSIDDIIVTKQAVLTVNVSDAVCKSITLGAAGQNNNGELLFNSASQVTVSGIVTFATHGNRYNTLTMTLGGRLICQGFAVGTGNNSFIPGTGTVELTASNTLPSTIVTSFNNLIISGGTTTLAANTNAAGALTLKAGTTLALGTYTFGTPTSLSLECGAAGSTISGSGTLTLNGNVNVTYVPTGSIAASISCPVLLNATRTFTVENDGSDATDLAVSGILGGTGGVIKVGEGTMVLSGANAYTGTTTVSAGVLNIQNATATGTAAGGVTVAIGAALQIQGGITVGAEALTLNGTGIGTTGALRNISGDNTWGGPIDVGTGTMISSEAGTLTLDVASGNAITSGYSINFDGPGNIIIADPINLTGGSRAITKFGTGTLTLSAANSYTGPTAVNGGVLNIQNSTATGETAGGVTVASGAALQIQGGITVGNEALSISGTGISNDGALRNISGDNTWGGIVTLLADTKVSSDAGTLTVNAITGTFNLIFDGVGNTTVAGPIETGAGTIEKTGSGTLTLSAANTYTGATTVSAGVLNIQNATATGTPDGGVTVVSGAALQIQDGITVGAEALTLNGTGIGTTGALRNISGDNTWGGPIEAGIGTMITSEAGTLTLDVALGNAISSGFSINFDGAGNITVADPIVLTGGDRALNKDGTGTLTLSAANIYSGPTNVNAGVLQYGAVDVIYTGGVVLNGGTLSTGAVAGYSDEVGTLILTDNSIIALGTGNHTVTFADSQSESWTTGTIVTVTGWTGTKESSGTEGKINFSLSSDLTATQLNQIVFLIDEEYYQAMMLGTGEVVPVSSPITIITGSISGSPFCAGSGLEVPFTYARFENFPSTIFTAQLSDAAGSFSEPVTLETIGLDNSGSQSIFATIPSVTAAGSGYRIRVVSNNPVITGSDNGISFSVIAKGTWIGGPGDLEPLFWGTGANWCGGVPESPDNIIIPAGVKVHINYYDYAPAVCNNLTINGTLIIDAGRALNVFGDLANNGTLTIESSSVIESGSLIVTGTTTGIVTYNRYLPADEYSHYISSPVGSLTTTISDGVRSWNEVTGLFETASITSASPSGVGYVLNTTASSLAFTGSVVNSAGPILATSPYSDCDFAGGETVDYSLRLYAVGRNSGAGYGGGGWNLLGNPFTSAMIVSTFIDVNDGESGVATDGSFDPNYEAVYIYDGTGYSYKGIEVPGFSNAGEGVFGYDYLQVGQGFFVLSHCNTSSFLFTPAMRIHSSTVPYTKSASADDSWSGLRLKVKSGETERSALVVYNENMTAGLDPGYDLGQLSGDSEVEIYTTLAAKDNGVNFTRQALPLTAAGTIIVPVGVDTEKGGEVTFSAFTIPMGNNKFWLEDRTTGVFTDLGLKSYTVTLQADTYGTGRFYIIASANTPTAIRQPDAPGGDLRIWVSGRRVIIQGEVSEGSLCELFDIQGRKLLEQNLTDSERNTVDLPVGLHGLVLVRVTDGQKVVTTKVAVL